MKREKSANCMQNWSSVIPRLNFLKFFKNDKISYETCRKCPLWARKEQLHRLSFTGWKYTAAFYSFNKVITTEYILGTWVLKISTGLDSKFCHLLLCDLEQFTYPLEAKVSRIWNRGNSKLFWALDENIYKALSIAPGMEQAFRLAPIFLYPEKTKLLILKDTCTRCSYVCVCVSQSVVSGSWRSHG